MTALSDFVIELERRLEPLEVELNHAWWEAATFASAGTELRRRNAELALSDALADANAFSAAAAFRATRSTTDDPLLVRRLELLHHQLSAHQLDPNLRGELVRCSTAIDSAFSNFRAALDGRSISDNDIATILRNSDDVDLRRRAWEASKQVGTVVADDIRALAHLRNRAARALGHRDHFAMALATNELDEDRLLATLQEVDDVSAVPFSAWKASLDAELAARFSCTVDALAPWHYDDPFFQDPPTRHTVDLAHVFDGIDVLDRSRFTFDSFGLDVHRVLDRSDLLSRPGKNQHAFCADLDRAGDVRVLANIVANEQWLEIMLHELGHAVYDLGTDATLPWSLRTMHPLLTEGVAMLCGHLARSPEWLHRVAGIADREVEALRDELAASKRASVLVFIRWALVMINFERGLYADPDADHDTRWWDLVGHYQGLRTPFKRQAPDWAAKIHIASAPVYYQNYLFGQLFAVQLDQAIRTRFGGLIVYPEAGRFLSEELFAPGASQRWDRLIESCTGEPLSAHHLHTVLGL